MVWLIALAVLMLVFAPTRKLILAYWYIVLPGAAGLGFGLNFAFKALAEGAPPILLLLLPLFAVACFVGAFKEAFGRKSHQRDDQRDGKGR